MTTLMLLHAFPLDERMWEPQLEALPEAVAPRLYGRGNTMDAWASSLLAEHDGPLVAAGASMGGYCALALARLAPERVRGVVLVGSRADADTPERRAGRADTIELIRREGAAGLWRSMRPKLFADDADEAVVAQAEAIARAQEPARLVEAVAAIRDRPDSTEAARRVPLRLVVGDRDPFVDELYAREWGGTVVPGCGHLVGMERPEVVTAAIGEAAAEWR